MIKVFNQGLNIHRCYFSKEKNIKAVRELREMRRYQNINAYRIFTPENILLTSNLKHWKVLKYMIKTDFNISINNSMQSNAKGKYEQFNYNGRITILIKNTYCPFRKVFSQK